jgi:hypothetical protein
MQALTSHVLCAELLCTELLCAELLLEQQLHSLSCRHSQCCMAGMPLEDDAAAKKQLL